MFWFFIVLFLFCKSNSVTYRSYNASFTTSTSLDNADLWLQWSVFTHGYGYNNYTGWINIGQVVAGYEYSVTASIPDIGSDAVVLWLGMFGPGMSTTTSSTLSSITTMNSYYEYSNSITFGIVLPQYQVVVLLNSISLMILLIHKNSQLIAQIIMDF